MLTGILKLGGQNTRIFRDFVELKINYLRNHCYNILKQNKFLEGEVGNQHPKIKTAVRSLKNGQGISNNKETYVDGEQHH